MRTFSILSFMLFVAAALMLFFVAVSASGTITPANLASSVLIVAGVMALWSAVMHAADSLRSTDRYFTARMKHAERGRDDKPSHNG